MLGGVLLAVLGAAAFATLAVPTQEASAVSDPRREPPIVRLVTPAPVAGFSNPVWRDSGALAATMGLVAEWLGLSANILGIAGADYM